MKKSKRQSKSNIWLDRQNSDQFVKKARKGGYRARAVFKLEQIDKKHQLIKPDTKLVDLGSAPGSWSQYAVKRVNHPAQVVAVDILPMDEVPGVQFINGDFTQEDVIQRILGALEGAQVDLVLSDMAPNITGIRATDQARAEILQRSILQLCEQALKPGGGLLTKLFEGETAIFMRLQMKTLFNRFQVVKPEASRSESKEIFLLARGYSGVPTNKVD